MKRKEVPRVISLIDGREPQDLDSFIRECALIPSAQVRLVADAVRKSLAHIAPFSDDKLRASDSFPGSLEVLPGWDSLDFIHWQMMFEDYLGEPAPVEEFGTIGSSFNVADLVKAGSATRINSARER